MITFSDEIIYSILKHKSSFHLHYSQFIKNLKHKYPNLLKNVELINEEYKNSQEDINVTNVKLKEQILFLKYMRSLITETELLDLTWNMSIKKKKRQIQKEKKLNKFHNYR